MDATDNDSVSLGHTGEPGAGWWAQRPDAQPSLRGDAVCSGSVEGGVRQ